MKQPKGICKVVGAESIKLRPHAVYAKVVVEDEIGQQFYFTASAFNFDLRGATKEVTDGR
jgi:hypothetical protein